MWGTRRTVRRHRNHGNARGAGSMAAGMRGAPWARGARILSILHSMEEGGKISEGIYISGIFKKPLCSTRGTHGVFIAGMDLGHADFRASGAHYIISVDSGNLIYRFWCSGVDFFKNYMKMLDLRKIIYKKACLHHLWRSRIYDIF